MVDSSSSASFRRLLRSEDKTHQPVALALVLENAKSADGKEERLKTAVQQAISESLRPKVKTADVAVTLEKKPDHVYNVAVRIDSSSSEEKSFVEAAASDPTRMRHQIVEKTKPVAGSLVVGPINVNAADKKHLAKNTTKTKASIKDTTTARGAASNATGANSTDVMKAVFKYEGFDGQCKTKDGSDPEKSQAQKSGYPMPMKQCEQLCSDDKNCVAFEMLGEHTRDSHGNLQDDKEQATCVMMRSPQLVTQGGGGNPIIARCYVKERPPPTKAPTMPAAITLLDWEKATDSYKGLKRSETDSKHTEKDWKNKVRQLAVMTNEAKDEVSYKRVATARAALTFARKGLHDKKYVRAERLEKESRAAEVYKEKNAKYMRLQKARSLMQGTQASEAKLKWQRIERPPIPNPHLAMHPPIPQTRLVRDPTVDLAAERARVTARDERGKARDEQAKVNQLARKKSELEYEINGLSARQMEAERRYELKAEKGQRNTVDGNLPANKGTTRTTHQSIGTRKRDELEATARRDQRNIGKPKPPAPPQYRSEKRRMKPAKGDQAVGHVGGVGNLQAKMANIQRLRSENAKLLHHMGEPSAS
jgi:hypothetical protein